MERTKLTGRSSAVWLSLLGGFAATTLAPACSDDFEGCEASLECESPGSPGGAGGEDGAGEGGTANGATGGEASGAGGPSVGTGGDAAGGSGSAEPDPCDALECLHGGSCVVEGDTASCDCAGTGYEGEACEDNINECADSPCENGTDCDDTEGSYVCDCSSAPDYTGKRCDALRFEALPEGFIPADVSPEGRVVVGHIDEKATKYLNGEEVFLGTYVGDANSLAFAASADGATIVGASGSGFPLTTTSRAVVWKGASIDELEMPEGYAFCEASDVSADGKVIAGTCDYEIVRWVDGELEVLGRADEVDVCDQAVVSDDGKILGGSCRIANSSRAFIWSEEEGFQLLVSLQAASGCLVNHLSTDGAKATGYCAAGGSATVALYWSVADGPQELEGAMQASLNAGAGLSGDGAFVVGHNGYVASVWDDVEAASKPLVDFLPPATPGLADWELREGVAVSSDGKIIVGKGKLEAADRSFIVRVD